MTGFAERTATTASVTTAVRRRPLGQFVMQWLTTTDHKVSGHL